MQRSPLVVDLWFAIVSTMLIGYVVLDGFDFGSGALHLFVAKTDDERRQVFAAIGPYWDGNEVWLVAAGGALLLAFPHVLASALSGFYFAIFLVLWALILRGISIEFRSHVKGSLWRAAWDAAFAIASTALPVLFGAAIGNLVRGLPLDEDGWFALPLFTDFTARDPAGILDWYTVSAGVFALVAIAGHGATFLMWKTDGPVYQRSRRAAMSLYAAIAVLWPLLTVATSFINPGLLTALPQRRIALLSLLLAIGGLSGVAAGLRTRRDLQTFLGSCAFLTGMLAATAACVFPVMLRSIAEDARSLTAQNSSVPVESLHLAIRWWAIGFPLVLLYFYAVFRLHRGKAVLQPDS
jgi:cytochrome d ubiquinol oxidase subunit II